jgi:hypothetical protein
MANRMSEKEKMYWFVVLFPILWPFLPVLIIIDVFEATKSGVSELWHKMRRRPKDIMEERE